MNLRVFALAAATLAGCAALAAACGAPTLVVPPAPSATDAGASSADPCASEASIACKGKVATSDPSEGLCDAALGYLVCNGTCYSSFSFSCEIPDGYTLVALDGAPITDDDAGEDGGDGEAEPDAESADARVDAKPADAAIDAASGDSQADAASDAESDAGSDAPGQPADAASADAPID